MLLYSASLQHIHKMLEQRRRSNDSASTTEATDGTAEVCWICLEEGCQESPLVSVCACPRVQHRRCLARSVHHPSKPVQRGGVSCRLLSFCCCKVCYSGTYVAVQLPTLLLLPRTRRWQLQSAGRSEENCCRFCFSRLPEWSEALLPPAIAHRAPVAVMAVVFENKVSAWLPLRAAACTETSTDR